MDGLSRVAGRGLVPEYELMKWPRRGEGTVGGEPELSTERCLRGALIQGVGWEAGSARRREA